MIQYGQNAMLTTCAVVVKEIISSLKDEMQKSCLQEFLKANAEGIVPPIPHVAAAMGCPRSMVYNLLREIVSGLAPEQRESVYDLL